MRRHALRRRVRDSLSRRVVIALAILSAFASGEIAFAAESASQSGQDLNRGRQIVIHGTNGVPACASCHGEKGAGDGSGAFPRLTGQLPFYLYQQLRAFADGTRPGQIMGPIAKGLSDQDMRAVAGYFSEQQAPYFPQPFLGQKVLEAGGKLAAIGKSDQNVPACATCHGEAGKGSGQLFPVLGGQYQSYLIEQLRNFKSGVRHNDPMAVMRNIAAKLDDTNLQALSAYFASVRPVCSCTAQPPNSASTAKGQPQAPASNAATAEPANVGADGHPQ